MQMIEKYRHFDAKQGLRDGTRIRFERIEEPDDCPDAPDERQDGFWPSQDPEDAGWVGAENYEDQMAKAHERMAAWKRGDWSYIGIIARAHVTIVRGSTGTTYTLDSPGVWGVESDSGDYLDELYHEERETLLADLIEMAKFEVVD